MSFAEFQIRLFAYQRVQEREWDKVRFVAFNAMRGSHLDPKKMPKTLQTFLKLKIDGNHNNTISEAMKERYLQEMEKYIKQTNISNGKS
jgi:hypothetical protein